MDCEQALHLISAQLDHEILPADEVSLSGHLRECAVCAWSAEALRTQDAELRRAYTGCEGSAASVAERAIARLRAEPAAFPPKTKRRRQGLRQRFQWALAAAALFAVVALSIHFWPQPPEPQSIPSHASDTTSGTRSSVVELNFLSPRPRPESKAARALTVGEEVRTGKGERCRLSLPDRSVLYVNDNSAVKLTADRRLALSR